MAQSLSPTRSRPPAKRLIPVLLGGAGLVLLGGGGVLVGLNSKLTSLQTVAQQKDAEVSSSRQIAHRYQATLDTYTQTQAHIQYLETSVSDKSYVPTLLAQLQGLAAQTHLTMSAVRPTLPPPAAAPAPTPAAGADGAAVGTKKAPAPPPYDTLDVGVDVSGSYADTSMFLYSLTRFPKIISVDSVEMHPTSATPGGPQVVATSLKLTAFMFHDAPDGTQPTGLPAASSLPTSSSSPTPSSLPTPSSVPAVSALQTPPSAPAPRLLIPGPSPASASPTVGGAAGRAAFGAVSATQAASTHSTGEIKTL